MTNACIKINLRTPYPKREYSKMSKYLSKSHLNLILMSFSLKVKDRRQQIIMNKKCIPSKNSKKRYKKLNRSIKLRINQKGYAVI